MKYTRFLLISLLFTLAIISCKEKSKPAVDESTLEPYKEICKKINKCDKNVERIANSQPLGCEKMVGSLKQAQDKLPQGAKSYDAFIECVNQAPCEKLDTSSCITRITAKP